MKYRTICVAALLGGLSVQTGLSATSINIDNAFAYGANIGWLNLRGDGTGGAELGLFYSTGYVWSPNVGWIRLGSGTPANGWAYANDSENDWGVNHDGDGNLTGYAYGANIGWLNFGHGETGYEPQVDFQTGALSGYIWGANVGWISLSNSQAFAQTDHLAPGPDGTVAGVPSAWEAMMGTNLDGMSDDEVRLYYTWGSNPTTPNGARITWIEEGTIGGSNAVQVTWGTRASRQYQLEMTPDLLDDEAWEDAGFGVMNGVNGAILRSIPYADTTNRFFRVRPHVPLVP